jgi:hypothetical protein
MTPTRATWATRELLMNWTNLDSIGGRVSVRDGYAMSRRPDPAQTVSTPPLIGRSVRADSG